MKLYVGMVALAASTMAATSILAGTEFLPYEGRNAIHDGQGDERKTVAVAASYRLEYAFPGGAGGAGPDSRLLDYQGTLYGVTATGKENAEEAYAFDPVSGAVTVLQSLGGLGGYLDDAGLTRFHERLYGTVWDPNGDGMIYSIDPATGHSKVAYTFKGGLYGWHPAGDMVRAGDLLYGVTVGCGDPENGDDGTVFSFDPKTGVEGVIYAFKGAPDGSAPIGGLTVVDGRLYGTTSNGGSSGACFLGCGTVFEVEPATGAETIVHSFSGGTDGALPSGGLTKGEGQLYGVTSQGGGSAECSEIGCGAVFSIDPATNAETVLHVFQNHRDGREPLGRLARVGKSLYGATYAGGAFGNGVVFSVNVESGADTVLHAFRGGQDGAAPKAGLTYAGKRLFGTTGGGGVVNAGTVFSIRP